MISRRCRRDIHIFHGSYTLTFLEELGRFVRPKSLRKHNGSLAVTAGSRQPNARTPRALPVHAPPPRATMSRILIICALISATVIAGNSGANRRRKRYLVYPDGGPARAQFIIGLGIPVDLKEQSVTVGTVIKFQYDLPTNSTEYTSRIYGFADTVSRGIEDVPNGMEDDDKSVLARDENLISGNNNTESVEEEFVDENNTLVDLEFDNNHEDDRKRRALVYSEGGSIDTYDIVNPISLDQAIRQQEILEDKTRDEEMTPQRANRWDFYKMLEHMVERYGYSGRPCLLRTVCEAAEVPFTHENGLLGEIGHILFTPSTTTDEVSHHSDNEYHAAERLGREPDTDCERLFPECENSILDTFTQIGLDTLHKFGFQ